MKYAQMIMGLLIGTALGGAVVASQGGHAAGTGKMDVDAIKQIVRDTINEDPKIIIDAVQKYQDDQRKDAENNASEALKDADTHALIYDDENVAFTGPKDSKKVLVEFFDYNCPACKMQFRAVDQLVKKDKDVKVLFHEYPIFGPQSDMNAKIGLAVFHLYPEKYFAFHEKMMSNEGRTDEAAALGFAKSLGMDTAKIKEYAASPAAQASLDNSHKLGEKLAIQGTPTLVIGDQVVPHAVELDMIEKGLNGGAE